MILMKIEDDGTITAHSRGRKFIARPVFAIPGDTEYYLYEDSAGGRNSGEGKDWYLSYMGKVGDSITLLVDNITRMTK